MIWLLVVAVVALGATVLFVAIGRARREIPPRTADRSTTSAATCGRPSSGCAPPPTSSAPVGSSPDAPVTAPRAPPVRFERARARIAHEPRHPRKSSSSSSWRCSSSDRTACPEVGRQVGGAMRELRKMQDSVKSELAVGACNDDSAELRRADDQAGVGDTGRGLRVGARRGRRSTSRITATPIRATTDHGAPPAKPEPGFDGPFGILPVAGLPIAWRTRAVPQTGR